MEIQSRACGLETSRRTSSFWSDLMIQPQLKVLITGGASGIGWTIAKALLEQGARVHLCDTSSDLLAQALRQQPAVSGSVADVSNAPQVESLFDDVQRCLGGLDVLVNNAGIAGPTAAVEDIAPDDWSRTLAVNITGQFLCARLAVPLLKGAGGGSIINMSSAAGRLGYPLRTPYAASKWAVIGFTESLAMELGSHNIRVNAILPGLVQGERITRVLAARAQAQGLAYEEMERQYLERVSLRRMVSPADVAAMVLFLCSPAGRNISGQSLGVCGNMEVLR
jgi:NAD(P)-dependent dehydrogenase (short-subunit alcohol dehydrogenase family)